MTSMWLGKWEVESIDGQPAEQNLGERLNPDIFISWNYTFYDDGRFESKILQDTGKGIMTTTVSGTYQISGNIYTTRTTSAIASINETSMPIPEVGDLHQTGTWSRSGDTLTLIPDGSSIKALKRIYE